MNNEIKKNIIMISSIIIVVLILIVGATFAYFAFGASNTTITGNMVSVDLTLAVEKNFT